MPGRSRETLTPRRDSTRGRVDGCAGPSVQHRRQIRACPLFNLSRHGQRALQSCAKTAGVSLADIGGTEFVEKHRGDGGQHADVGKPVVRCQTRQDPVDEAGVGRIALTNEVREGQQKLRGGDDPLGPASAVHRKSEGAQTCVDAVLQSAIATIDQNAAAECEQGSRIPNQNPGGDPAPSLCLPDPIGRVSRR